MLFQNSKHPIELKITHLNKVQERRKQQLQLEISQKKDLIATLKKTFLENSPLAKSKKNKADERNVYVLDFVGDLKATPTLPLREEINALLSIAKTGDEVVLRLESGGGLVHAYGLAAAQLARIKEASLMLTVCVDKIAASGGYMMACVADKILAAPFAVVGSIGVVAQVPNFHDLLEKHDIDVDVFTAGKYKRTVTIFGKNDEEDKQKFQEELEQTHHLFQEFVATYRPKLDLDKVATGEHWYGKDAIERQLVDELMTSDTYILQLLKTQQVYTLHSRQKPTLAEKIGITNTAQAGLESLVKVGMTTAVKVLADKLPDALQEMNNHKKY